MPEFDRLSGCIEWIDLSFVERRRTPKWAIQVSIRCHIVCVSTRDASQFLDELGVKRGHIAIHNRVHKADLQHISIVSADQFAADDKMICINGNDYWLYGTVNPETSEIAI
jgi:transposase-like protein